MKILVTPSILSANFACLQKEVDSVEPYADWLQVDVMDGHFVPNLSFGAPVLKWVKTKLPLDIHLMVSNPADRIAEFAALNVKHITFHAEAVPSTNDRRALMEGIKSKGATSGIALNPETTVSAINDVINEVDLVLIMSVNPGFGAQTFMPDVLKKIASIRAEHPKLMIQIDGGIDEKTSKEAVKAGANNLVAGNYIFSARDRKKAIETLRS